MPKPHVCLPALAVALLLLFAGPSSIAPAAGRGAKPKPGQPAARPVLPRPGTPAARRAAIWRRQTAIAISRKVANLQLETAHWLALMGKRSTLSRARTLSGRTTNLDWQRTRLRAWTKKAAAVRKAAHHPPRLHEWLCIHSYEGSWTDTGAPYYGGLQMDMEFQATYGPELLRSKGTANHWTPLEQIWVAERAYRSGRGFYPWPNTARYCGLL